MITVQITTTATKIVTLDEAQTLNWIGCQNRWDWKAFDQAKVIAEKLTTATGKHYIATDAGAHVSPRFDVAEVPQVGDAVSMSFNGDSYPVGNIVKISKTLKRITTSTGKVFTRKRETGCWSDGTFSMIACHISEKNPHF